MNCIKKYKHCLRGLPRELFNMVAQHAREILQERCGSAKGRHGENLILGRRQFWSFDLFTVFLKHIRCLDDENTKISKCMDKVIILLNFIAEEVDGNHEDLLTASCCAGHYLLDCFMSRISQACKHLEGHDSGPYIVEKINSMVAGTFDIACSKHPSLAQCDKDHGELMKKFREKLTPEDKIQQQAMSPLIPLIKIAKKLKFWEWIENFPKYEIDFRNFSTSFTQRLFPKNDNFYSADLFVFILELLLEIIIKHLGEYLIANFLL